MKNYSQDAMLQAFMRSAETLLGIQKGESGAASGIPIECRKDLS
jgi:hypothetical protein